MQNEHDGGAAFPRLEEVRRFDEEAGRYKTHLLPVEGMSLRDYFAAKAMQSIACADADNGRFRDGVGRTAQFAYDMADAMLAEREKRS